MHIVFRSSSPVRECEFNHQHKNSAKFSSNLRLGRPWRKIIFLALKFLFNKNLIKRMFGKCDQKRGSNSVNEENALSLHAQ